jgi:hypothetical protein
LSHGNGGIGLAIVRQTDTGNQSAELAPHVQFVNSTIAAPATARANIFRAFISFLLSGFVLDRIYRIYKIKNVASFSQNPVNLVNPVQKPSRDNPRKYLSSIHDSFPS